MRKPFYGWAIIGVGSLVAFSSGPGQSYVFSVFIDSIIEDTGLERATVSTLYAVGTGVSAVMVMLVSRLADRQGARRVLVLVAVALGLACFAIAFSRGFVAFFFAFAALRALGQGSLTINATLLAAQWFVRLRGRAMALMGLGFPLSVALLPPISRLLIDNIGWREAYMVLGVMVWVLVLPGALFIVRDRPEEVGLHPDGADHPPEGEIETVASGQPDRRPVLTSVTFWLLAVPLSTSALVVTGLVFHQTAIFGERGLSAGVAAAVFVPYAIASAGSSLGAGFAIDRVGPKRMFAVAMALLLLAMGLLFLITSPATAFVYGAALGAAGGVSQIITSVTWAHFYGRHGLGRIQGSAVMVNITASALGPMPLAALEAYFGRFGPGIVMMGALPLLSLVMISFARPQRSQAGARTAAPG